MRVHRIFLRGDSERPLDGIILGPMKSAQTEFRIVLTFDRAVWKMSRNYSKVGVLTSDQSHINFLLYLRDKAGMTNPHKRRAKDSIAATDRPKRERKPPQRYIDDYNTSKWMHEKNAIFNVSCCRIMMLVANTTWGRTWMRRLRVSNATRT